MATPAPPPLLLEPGPQTEPPLLFTPPVALPPLPFPKVMPLQFEFCPHPARARNNAATTSKANVRIPCFIQFSLPIPGASQTYTPISHPDLGEHSGPGLGTVRTPCPN